MIGIEYDLAFIMENPIQSVCLKCKRHEPIHAAQLENVRCFWCRGKVRAVDPAAYRERIANLWRYVAGGPIRQLALFGNPEQTRAP